MAIHIGLRFTPWIGIAPRERKPFKLWMPIPVRCWTPETFLSSTMGSTFFGGSASSETVTVSPASVSLSANQQKQFTASVTGTSNQTVSWSISAVNPASAPAGNISSTGLYTAPATIAPAQVTIKATSADGTASGTATVNLSNGAVANFT